MTRTRIFILLIIVAAIACYFFWPVPQRSSAWRASMVPKLTSATTFAELRNACGGLGAFVERSDGTWIAIAYRDTHMGSNESLSLAVDSDGNWMESSYHFCAGISNYQDRVNRAAERDAAAAAETNPAGREADEQSRDEYRELAAKHFLGAAQTAATLADARNELARNHFVPVTTPMPPMTLRGAATRAASRP